MAGLHCVITTACDNSGKAGGGPPPDPAVEVVLQKVGLEPVEDLLNGVGTVEANERVELKPEASGIIESIHFTEGQQVKRGEKLFSLDPHKEKSSLAQAEAEEKLARANVGRAQQLIGTKAISQQDFEHLQSQVEVKAAMRQVEQQRLTERTVIAPFDGVLGPRLISPGQYVTMGTSLGTLVDNSQVKVSMRIPERQLALVRIGQEGRIRVAAYPNRVFTGKIDLINAEVDAPTRTAQIRLLAPNPDGLLKPGMFARVELVVGSRSQSAVIPESALVPSLDKFSVYVAEQGVARLKPVKLGVRLPGKVEVREGLSAGQVIVVYGTQKLVDGMKVVQEKAPPAAGAKAQ